MEESERAIRLLRDVGEAAVAADFHLENGTCYYGKDE